MKQDSRNASDRQAMNACREDIDRIDEQIISLLSSRQGLAANIGKLKRGLGIGIIDPAREQAVLRRLASKSQENLSARAIRNVFSEIISAARSVQDDPVVAYLGPEATFSHQAAISLYGNSGSFRAAENIGEIFGLVEKGICRQGVVHIENSFEGSVAGTLDLFYEYELKICAEIFLRIRHYLLSRAAHIEGIKHLYSHPMPIAQCHSWIKTNLAAIPITEVASTALAARMAADEPESAAVGSRLAGITYGLNILEEGIEDIPGNLTRFLVIGKGRSEPTGKDKTSLLFLLSHRPGALHGVLGALARRNINMTRIESRPMKTRIWEYLLFVDLEGHEQDGNVSEALIEMEENCVFIKRLGSYPEGREVWD